MSKRAFNPNLIVPVGTGIVVRVPVRAIGGGHVLPKGAVGVVTQPPLDGSHAYRVRFVDGSEAMLRRPELAILKHAQRWSLDYNLHEYVIFRCVVGSCA